MKLIRLIFSPQLTLLALILFAIAMGVATFIENDFGTQTARRVVYEAWWFEILMLILGMNFLGNIGKYRLYQRHKWPLLLFHLGFVVILLGAAVTRYLGSEGVMRIREGGMSNTIISDRNYMQLWMQQETDSSYMQKEAYFSSIQNNDFEWKLPDQKESLEIRYKNFITDAGRELVVSDEGEAFLELVMGTEKGKETMYLKSGGSLEMGNHGHQLHFGSESNDVRIFSRNDSLFIVSNEDLDFFKMLEQSGGKLLAGQSYPLAINALYKGHDFSFVPVRHVKKGLLNWVSRANKPKENSDALPDVLTVTLSKGDAETDLDLIYRHGHLPGFTPFELEGVKGSLGYGSLPVELDFALELRDFQLERYPGSTSPSSYASEVTVVDGDQKMDYRIYMNHVLDHKGYRFFQASYDSDEMGTVLAVNQDRPGTLISYLGYILMGIGMFFTLFSKGSRFQLITYKLKQLSKSGNTTLLLLLMTLSVQAQFPEPNDSLAKAEWVDKAHAAQFGRLMVQDLDGRIKPINTLASEFLRKVTRKTYVQIGEERFDANQVFIAIHRNPETWAKLPLIKVNTRKGGEILKALPVDDNGLVPFEAFIPDGKTYILESYVREANAKKPSERNEFDKEMISVDERFNVLFNTLTGNYLRIFPRKDDENNTWFGPNHHFDDFEEENGRFAKGIIPLYFMNLEKGMQTDNYKEAEDAIAYIRKYQQVLAADLLPTPEQVEAELWYNELNLNFWLFQVYFSLGIILLIVALIHIFNSGSTIRIISYIGVVLTLLAFLIHSGNLILRWYIAEYPPWSNGYEMIVFVSWALILFGLYFFRRSDFSLPLANLFAGTLLFVSYLDWLNPEITSLMPVLKSYWLKIHVATIISSYAPLALSALLGVMALVLLLIRNSSNRNRIDRKIEELTYINELSMTIGLFVLSIGTFLGGVWANESWGRYWAWDPKETWALISIIVYTIVLHMRFIPSLRNSFSLNNASIYAFFSIIMTSFGVNYYLTGLHSYATGDPVPIPKFVYVVVAILVVLSIMAYRKVLKDKVAGIK